MIFYYYIYIFNLDAFNGSYCQFRPVCYVNPKRALNSQKELQHYKFDRKSMLPLSILTAYYGKSNVNVYGMNITFGQSKDGFYAATQYTSW